VPGKPKDEPEEPPKPEKQLHVEMRGENKFQLKWKEGSTVVSESEVARNQVDVGEDVTFPDLAKKIESEWQAQGSHKNPTDKKFDRAVLHTDNDTPYGHMIGVLDAIYNPQREYTIAGGSTEELPAFQVTFASD
jgi:biopolymer transport protein ExbD